MGKSTKACEDPGAKFTVALGSYSLERNEVGKPLGWAVQRQHDNLVDALLDLEQAIDTGEGHQRGCLMGCTYRIVMPDGSSLALNSAYKLCFGVDRVRHDNKADTYPELRKAERYRRKRGKRQHVDRANS